MSEQGITQDDERWITERDNEPGASFRTAMRAAIARGYERGKAEGAADRDRLAKRCEYLDDVIGAMQNADVRDTDRLAALEQRVGALIDMEADVTSGAIGWTEYRARIAALRSPGVASSEVDGLRAQLADVTRERDVYRRGDERARKAVHELSEERATALRDLATARRERDEALGVVRRYLEWRDSEIMMEVPNTVIAGVVADMRALVAGQPVGNVKEQLTPCETVLATRDAEIKTLRAKLADAEREWKATREAELAMTRQAQMWADERDALRAHALKLDGLCERAGGALTRWHGPWCDGVSVESLEEETEPLLHDLRARGEVPR